MATHEYYNPSPQAVPGPGILKPTAGYPTLTYHQQPRYNIPANQPEHHSPAVYNSQNYSRQQSHYPPTQQNREYNPAPPHGYQAPTQQPYHRDAHHQYPAVEPQTFRNLPPHLRPRRSISEPPDPRSLAHHIPGYNHRGRSRSSSSSSSSSPERSRSRPRSRYRVHSHSHSRARSTRSVSRARREHSRSRSRHSRTSGPRPRNNHTHTHNHDHHDHHHHHKHKDRNTFLGAFGGGAIGDLIMPGLGILGGALLGGVGGREASRNGHKSDKGGRREGRGIFGWRKTYDEEWREGRIERGEISE